MFASDGISVANAPLSRHFAKAWLGNDETHYIRRWTEKDIAEREITLMADKSMPYEVLKKVMGTCTDADYGRISFALLQKDRPVDMAKLRHGL